VPFYVVADTLVAQSAAFDAFDEEAGVGGNPARCGIVGVVPEFQAV
jgi:hypothetical protein